MYTMNSYEADPWKRYLRLKEELDILDAEIEEMVEKPKKKDWLDRLLDRFC